MNIQLMLLFLKVSFLVVYFGKLMSLLIMLSVIFLYMLMIMLFTQSVIRVLILATTRVKYFT